MQFNVWISYTANPDVSVLKASFASYNEAEGFARRQRKLPTVSRVDVVRYSGNIRDDIAWKPEQKTSPSPE